MKHILNMNDLKFCVTGNCGNCYSTCQSQYKNSSGMTTHECENDGRFEYDCDDECEFFEEEGEDNN